MSFCTSTETACAKKLNELLAAACSECRPDSIPLKVELNKYSGRFIAVFSGMADGTDYTPAFYQRSYTPVAAGDEEKVVREALMTFWHMS